MRAAPATTTAMSAILGAPLAAEAGAAVTRAGYPPASRVGPPGAIGPRSTRAGR